MKTSNKNNHIIFKDDEDYSNEMSENENNNEGNEKLFKMNKRELFLQKQKERNEYQKMNVLLDVFLCNLTSKTKFNSNLNLFIENYNKIELNKNYFIFG